MTPEDLGEMGCGNEAGGSCDGRDRELRVCQKLLRGPDPYSVVIFEKGHSRPLVEGPEQVVFIYMQGIGQLPEGELFQIMLLHQGLCGAHQFPSHILTAPLDRLEEAAAGQGIL